MTDWPTVRAEVATLFTGVAITSPISTSIVRVYQQPPGDSTPDQPSVVIVGADKQTRRLSALRRKTYTMHGRLLVYDANTAQAQAILDALEEALIAVIDQHVNLGGICSLVTGPDWSVEGWVDIGGNRFVAADFTMQIDLDDGVAFLGG